MKDTIYRQAAINELQDEFKKTPTTAIRAMNVIRKLSSAQLKQKKGKWNHGLCSVCGYDWGKDAPIANVPPYCPNCGAYMRDKEDGE